MKILSLDTETTGVNVELGHQLLQVAGVLYDFKSDLNKPVEELPFFNVFINHKVIIGHPYALAMNANIIKKLSEWDGTKSSHPLPKKFMVGDIIEIDELPKYISDFLQYHKIEGKMTLAGKNVGTFDLPFLRTALEDDYINKTFHRRTYDPSILFFNEETDEVIPSLDEIKKRLGLSPVTHCAKEDARDIIRVIKAHYKKDSE